MEEIAALAGGIAGKKEVIRGGEYGTHPIPWPYSHGVKIGNVLFIAGQIAFDNDLNIVGDGDPVEQTRQVWRNIEKICVGAGGKVTDIVRVLTWLADIDDMDAVLEVRREFFPDGDYPVASMFEAQKMGAPGLLLETEAVAVIGCS